jgi:hypothetical protein
MNNKLLIATFLGIESIFFFPIVDRASASNTLNTQSVVKTEEVSLSQTASKPLLLAGYHNDYDRYNYNRDYYRNNNRRDVIRIEEPYRYLEPIRVQERFIVVPPRRYVRDNYYRNYNNYNNYNNNNFGEVFLRFGF